MFGYDDVALFAAVARTSSFIGASRELGMPTSTVSRRIAALELKLNVQLLLRTTRNVTLTEAGAALAQQCATAFEEIDRAMLAASPADTASRLSGRLRVTVPPLAGADTFGPWLLAFAARHPALRLELLVTNAFLELAEDAIDLAFRLGPLPETRDIVRRLWSVPYVLCAAPQVVRQLPDLTDPQMLQSIGLIRTPPISDWLFVATDGRKATFRPGAAVSTCIGDLPLGAMGARSGLGVAYLPRGLIAGSLAVGELELVSVEGWRPSDREMYAIYPPGRGALPKVRAAIDHVLEQRTRYPDGQVKELP